MRSKKRKDLRNLEESMFDSNGPQGQRFTQERLDALQARIAAHINGGPERERMALNAWNNNPLTSVSASEWYVATRSIYGPDVYPQ